MIQQDRFTKANHHFLKLTPQPAHIVFHTPETIKRDYKGIMDRLAKRIDTSPSRSRQHKRKVDKNRFMNLGGFNMDNKWNNLQEHSQKNSKCLFNDKVVRRDERAV